MLAQDPLIVYYKPYFSNVSKESSLEDLNPIPNLDERLLCYYYYGLTWFNYAVTVSCHGNVNDIQVSTYFDVFCFHRCIKFY